MDATVTQRSVDLLAEFVATTALDDIPRSVLEASRWLLIDSFACALAATSLLPEVDAVVGATDAFGAGSDSTLIGLGRRASPAAAAFVNGALIHGLNYDALGASYAHVAAGSVPSTLAMAERARTNGPELLAAVALSAEMTSRLAIAGNDPLSTRGWLMGQLLAVFSSAAGAARASGLDPRGTASALGVGLMQAAGTMQVMADGGAPAKSVYASFPALAGVVAVATAERGLDATMDVFGGPNGLFGRYLPHGDAGALTDGLGDRWYADALRYKRWPNTAVAHPFLQALDGVDAGARKVSAVRFGVERAKAAFFDPSRTAWHPSSVGTAGNSVPYAVARRLVTGAFDLNSLRPDAYGAPDVLALLDQTTVAWVDDGTEESVEVTFDDGSSTHCAVSAEGNGAPAPGKALIAKLRTCAQAARSPLADAEVEHLIAATMELDRADDLIELQGALGSQTC